MIEEDVEETDDEAVKALFVEAFGDRQTFFNVCVKELKKSEAIIEIHMDRTNYVEREESHDDIEDDELVPESQEDKLNVLLDTFKDKDLVTLTKYIKVFNQANTQILAVAHAKVNTDFDKLFKKLKFKPDDDDVKHVKSFTKPNGEQIFGRGAMVTTCCKIFYLNKLSKKFKDAVLNIFNMEALDDNDDGRDDEGQHLAASQDFPEHSQSRTTATLRICVICKYKTRITEEFEEHMSCHTKCRQCGLYFENETELRKHDGSFHATKTCEKCGKEILLLHFDKHMKAHKTEKGFSKVVHQGKVKAGRAKNKNDEKTNEKEKVKSVSGYHHFLKIMRPIFKDENPEVTPQEMIKLLNTAWNKEKENGRKKHWEEEAKKSVITETEEVVVEDRENVTDVPTDQNNHSITKCTICNRMISNVENHMAMHHQEQPVVDEPTIIDSSDTTTQVVDDDKPEHDDEARQQAVSTPSDSFSVGDIVLVQRKTIHWPAKIASIVGNTCEVVIFDKARTKDRKNTKYLMSFTTDQSICEGRSSLWVKAWKEAKQEAESQ